METPLTAHRVLVVDDDPSVLATYRRVLKRAGYHAELHNDPSAVLQDESLAQGVDLLLLDYKMPGMDGLSLLAELRHRECRARCVLISAYLNDDVRTQADHLGVDCVLNKPVDIQQLRTTLSSLLA